MTSVRDLELAVVQAAMAEHRGGCAPEACGGSRLDPCHLANVIEALTFGCPECNAGGHTCPGDGNPIPHGAGDCGGHDGQTYMTDVVFTPGQGAEHRAVTPDPDAEHLALLAMGSAQEWLNYAEWHDGSQIKITWQNGLSVRVVSDSGRGDVIGEFEITVFARRLPPPGPEEDGALRDELAAEAAQELIWVPRTWLDVRTGDDVRLPGTDNTAHVEHAVHQRWRVDPRTGTASWNPPQPLEWSGVKVTLRTTANPDQPAELTMDPAKPVEIKLAQVEADAIELLGWENRTQLITEETPA